VFNSGGVSERPKEAVLKTAVPQGTVGSNPTPSAIIVQREDREMPIADDLARIFTLQSGKPYLKTRESSNVEFKESFNRAGLAGYAKDFAAFANNMGGYMIFGIQNRPHNPVGLRNEQFDNTDESEITGILNECFAPAIEWSKYIHTWNRKLFGIIYVHQSNDKPIIAIKDFGRNQEIKSGEIYYRYAARTEKIRYAELKQIIDEKVKNERNAWYRLFERIAKIGPENAAILDTLAGKIESGDRTILIDDDLIPKLKFIREGEFDEKKGAISLRLVGDVNPVSVLGVKEKIVYGDPFRFKATDVAEQVANAIIKRFRVYPEHVKCWKYYKIRQVDNEGNVKCNPEYCEYKEAFKNYGYSRDWINFLIKELSNPDKYNQVIHTNA
jgi:hypothetical protein